MSDCVKCEPCETFDQPLCEEFSESLGPIKILAEEESFCLAAIPRPSDISLFQYTNNELQFNSGSEFNEISIPFLVDQDISLAPKIIAIDNIGEVKGWQPSNVGDNFLAYWDGTQFVIGTFESLLPSGNGVLVKMGSSLSFEDGTNGQYLIKNSGAIQFQTISPATPPTGTILCYSASVAPAGWLLCDGGIELIATYPELFAILGTSYGGDGISDFGLPDLRAEFIRGWDNDRGLDPLRSIGSIQTEEFEAHNHGGATVVEASHTHSISGTASNQSSVHRHFGVTSGFGASGDNLSPSNFIASALIESLNTDYVLRGRTTGDRTLALTGENSTGHTHQYSGTTSLGTTHIHSISTYGDTETRPANIALNWIIKT